MLRRSFTSRGSDSLKVSQQIREMADGAVGGPHVLLFPTALPTYHTVRYIRVNGV